MTEARTAREYDRWLTGGSPSGRAYRFLASVPGMMLQNTPVFRLDRELQLRPENRLLDIGCGRASLIQVLSSKVHFETPPVGVDLSREMLALAQRDLAASGTGARLARGTATSLPFRNDLFDIVTCSYVMKHLDDQGLRAFLAELLRVLKPGGFAIAWEFAPTGSRLLNRLNRMVLRPGVRTCALRS